MNQNPQSVLVCPSFFSMKLLRQQVQSTSSCSIIPLYKYKIQYFKCFIVRLFLSIFIICFFLRPIESLAEDKTFSVTGESLKQSITSYNNGEIGPIKLLLKTWNESYDGNSRFDFSFYGKFKQPQNIKNFLQTIKIFDDEKEIQVHEWNSADCSLEKMMLFAAKSNIYLVLANRVSKANSSEVIPQNEPAPHVLKLFKLFESDQIGSHYGPSKSKAFFKKITTYETSQNLCDPDEIYAEMLKFQKENTN